MKNKSFIRTVFAVAFVCLFALTINAQTTGSAPAATSQSTTVARTAAEKPTGSVVAPQAVVTNKTVPAKAVPVQKNETPEAQKLNSEINQADKAVKDLEISLAQAGADSKAALQTKLDLFKEKARLARERLANLPKN